MSIIKRIKQIIDFIRFKLNYWSVPVINPLKVGGFYSQIGQDVFLFARLFRVIDTSSNRTVIDIGCNHPIIYSNSFFFEKYLHCKTFAFDPIAEYASLWAELRPNASFHALALGDIEKNVVLNVPEKGNKLDDMFSSVDKNNVHLKNHKTAERIVPCRTLSSFLKEHSIKEVLFVSIDVEGFELEVLKGIDFESVKISCFIIENNSKSLYGSNEIRELLIAKGYIFIARIYCFDDVFIHKSLSGQLTW